MLTRLTYRTLIFAMLNALPLEASFVSCLMQKKYIVPAVLAGSAVTFVLGAKQVKDQQARKQLLAHTALGLGIFAALYTYKAICARPSLLVTGPAYLLKKIWSCKVGKGLFAYAAYTAGKKYYALRYCSSRAVPPLLTEYGPLHGPLVPMVDQVYQHLGITEYIPGRCYKVTDPKQAMSKWLEVYSLSTIGLPLYNCPLNVFDNQRLQDLGLVNYGGNSAETLTYNGDADDVWSILKGHMHQVAKIVIREDLKHLVARHEHLRFFLQQDFINQWDEKDLGVRKALYTLYQHIILYLRSV